MYLLYLTIFIMFFQPAAIWPAWEAYQPLRNSAILALLAYMFSQKRSAAPFLAEKVNKFFVAFVIMQVLSASAVWISGGVEIFNLWLRPNDIAIILVTAIPLALLVANTAKAMPTRILFMAIAGMFAFNILFTGSRNGMHQQSIVEV